MKLSKELLAEAKQCKSAEEIVALARENGMELSEIETAEAFAYLNKQGELSDSELNNVSGGEKESSCDTSGETPKYSVGDRVEYRGYCGVVTVVAVSSERKGICGEWLYTIKNRRGNTYEIYEHQIYGKA